jgi:hypothetical protein
VVHALLDAETAPEVVISRTASKQDTAGVGLQEGNKPSLERTLVHCRTENRDHPVVRQLRCCDRLAVATDGFADLARVVARVRSVARLAAELDLPVPRDAAAGSRSVTRVGVATWGR